MPPIDTDSTARVTHFVSDLCRFINEDLPVLHPRMKSHPNVAEQTPLFSSGTIDSMAILQLIAFVEERIGKKIPMTMVSMRYFETPRVIGETFMAGEF